MIFRLLPPLLVSIPTKIPKIFVASSGIREISEDDKKALKRLQGLIDKGFCRLWKMAVSAVDKLIF